MNEILIMASIAVVSPVIAIVVYNKLNSGKASSADGPSREVSKETVVVEAKVRAKEIELEAKNKALELTQKAQQEAAQAKNKLVEQNQSISIKKAQIDAKEKQLNTVFESKERQLETERKSIEPLKQGLEKKKQELDKLVSEQQNKLEKIAGLSKKDARKQLLESFERELGQDKGKLVREMEDEVKREADEKAKEILVYAMKQGASDYVVEHSSSKVKLPDDDLKGRIIGKEGRNIRKFEELTGVELDLDESPGQILISSFDPVRREVAKVSLEKLITDGRIQPAKIEEVVEKTQSEVEKIIFKEGDNLCHRLGVYNLPKDVVQALGRFKYRFSYGQNMIEHTLEVTKMGMAIAAEIGADMETVKLGCLFHDIGKILEGEGSHVQLGVDFLRKHKVKDEIIECVAEHHEDRPFSSVESVITHVADHISGARPSARSEDYAAYVKRLKDLEDAAYSFDGVSKAYAISAGREIRVFVKPDRVDDDSTALLAREIAKKIELEQTYPGVVKVIVIRETRVTETAK